MKPYKKLDWGLFLARLFLVMGAAGLGAALVTGIIVGFGW